MAAPQFFCSSIKAYQWDSTRAGKYNIQFTVFRPGVAVGLHISNDDGTYIRDAGMWYNTTLKIWPVHEFPSSTQADIALQVLDTGVNTVDGVKIPWAVVSVCTVNNPLTCVTIQAGQAVSVPLGTVKLVSTSPGIVPSAVVEINGVQYTVQGGFNLDVPGGTASISGVTLFGATICTTLSSSSPSPSPTPSPTPSPSPTPLPTPPVLGPEPPWDFSSFSSAINSLWAHIMWIYSYIISLLDYLNRLIAAVEANIIAAISAAVAPLKDLINAGIADLKNDIAALITTLEGVFNAGIQAVQNDIAALITGPLAALAADLSYIKNWIDNFKWPDWAAFFDTFIADPLKKWFFGLFNFSTDLTFLEQVGAWLIGIVEQIILDIIYAILPPPPPSAGGK